VCRVEDVTADQESKGVGDMLSDLSSCVFVFLRVGVCVYVEREREREREREVILTLWSPS
jgi:hypothetical protein